MSSVHLHFPPPLSVLAGRFWSSICVRDCLARWKMARLWRSRTVALAVSRALSLSPSHVHPGLSFAVEMVPAWANLHNTLLTPLLYSSITPRQLLQVRAFVWACQWLCKARHKRLISQLFSSPSLPLLRLHLSPPSVPLSLTPYHCPPPPPFSFIPCFHFTKPAERQQPDNENNNASIFFSLLL